MDRREFLKNRLIDFFMIQTGISVAVALIGSAYAPDHSLPYGAFLMPSVYAFFCTLPTFVTYSSYELSIKELMIRKAMELALILAVVLTLSYFDGAWLNGKTVLAIVCSVVVIYVLVGLGDYYMLRANAKQMNERLRRLQHYMQEEMEKKAQPEGKKDRDILEN